ncbi:hypothetical protein CWB96_00205 [Pseudoalteromonas citrea]|uniref:Uncharacterized protein n=1 Tax=Pseudoalteromonas citrea TaxID=43655 RepID=A0A5S3XVF4_9GAMM|nr:hypothetical protein [Pseudoalteromonas citrea]TMP46288.1 hypothetical protein CWB97_02200 [Pseudoalteromonas citrea]TMP63064.1 hypothetical protein CWB96_00205 [Pseudoalteromonas citrea]
MAQRVKKHTETTASHILQMEELHLVKHILAIALKKLGLFWSESSHDYTILSQLSSLSEVHQLQSALSKSEKGRAELLQQRLHLTQMLEQQSRERTLLLQSHTYLHRNECYRYTLYGQHYIVFNTSTGQASWLISDKELHKFKHLIEKSPPKDTLKKNQRVVAMQSLK